jgi:hypothetical protein
MTTLWKEGAGDGQESDGHRWQTSFPVFYLLGKHLSIVLFASQPLGFQRGH